MMKIFEKMIGELFNLFGFELRRHPHRTNPDYQLLRGLQYFKIDNILDVGANTGQFASQMRKIGFKGTIVSFEPLLTAYNELLKTAEPDPNWIIHSRSAIGDYEGEIDINVSENSVSSSILPILKAHTAADPASEFIKKEAVPISTLDTSGALYLQNSSSPFLKIDTQGYEWNVLDGAQETLPKLKGLHCELSLVELYEGQRLWTELMSRLQKEGFTLWNLQPGFTDPDNGRTLQMDATFFRIN